MIAQRHRFHGYGSLRYVYQNGKTVRGPIISIKYAPNSRRHDYRVAVVVSKKVHKSAVARNKIRRRLYEAVRLFEKQILSPYDIVITVFHEQLLEIAPEEVKKMVHAQLVQAGIIVRSSPKT